MVLHSTAPFIAAHVFNINLATVNLQLTAMECQRMLWLNYVLIMTIYKNWIVSYLSDMVRVFHHGDTQLEVIFIQFVALMYSEFTIDCDLSCDLGIWNWLWQQSRFRLRLKSFEKRDAKSFQMSDAKWLVCLFKCMNIY